MTTDRPLSKVRSLLCAAVLVLTLVLPAPARAELRRGEKSFGPTAGYVTRTGTAAAGIFFQYSLSRRVRLAPEVDVFFRNRDLAALSADINVHVPFGFENDKVALYPLAGLNYTSWSRHDVEEDKDVTTHRNNLGLNVGAGVELRCTQSLKLNVEGRYTFMKHYPTAKISLGIAYIF